MKIINLNLTEVEREELKSIIRKPEDARHNRSLAVLHCSEGKTATAIADMLKVTVQTVCAWLKAFNESRIDGLARKYSPGRPSIRKEKLIPAINKYLEKSPRDYGWGEDAWSVKTIISQFATEFGIEVSRDTVERALRDAGYSYKRAKKTVPSNAPSKEEKLQRVQKIADEIKQLKADGEVEVMFLDESHFSTDPYVTRGWHKRGEPFFPPDSLKKRRMHDIWGICAGERRILLEKRCEKQH